MGIFEKFNKMWSRLLSFTKRMMFRCSTFPYRHKEAFVFFAINVLIQLLPVMIALIPTNAERSNTVIQSNTNEEKNINTSKDINRAKGANEAVWSILVLSLWNVPFALRKHIFNKNKLATVQILFYALAFFTNVIYWDILFINPGFFNKYYYFDLIYPFFILLYMCILIGYINRYYLLYKVSIELLWEHQAQFAGIYVAKYYGLLTDRGIYLNIKRANINKTNSNTNQKFSGVKNATGCEFEIKSSTDIIKARADGRKIRAILNIVPESMRVIYKAELEINQLADLKGKRIGRHEGFEEEDIIKILLNNAGLDESDVSLKKINSMDCSEFRNGEVEVILGHPANEEYLLRSHNVDIKIITENNYKNKFFLDTLTVSEEVINTNSEVVRAVSQSISAGWKHTLAYRERGVKATLYRQNDYTEDNKEKQNRILTSMLSLIGSSSRNQGSLEPPFALSEKDWQPIIDAMHEAKIIKSKDELLPADMFWHQ